LHLMARTKSRVHGVQRLSEIGGAQVVDIFDKLQNDPSGEVRDAVNIALAKMIPGEGFDKPFLQAAADADETMRAAGLRALAELGNAEAVQDLDHRAADSSVLVREEAMRALSQFSSPETVLLLAKGAK